MRCLDEATATALAGEATVPISSAWTCCFLVTACTAVLDYERAFQWCDRIAEFAERYGSRYLLAFCRAEYGTVHLWRGQWADAQTLLESSIEDFSSSRPAWAVDPLVTLAELRQRQGRPGDVVRLLDHAGVSVASQLCRARLALDRGEALRGRGAWRETATPGARGTQAGARSCARAARPSSRRVRQATGGCRGPCGA
jgi:hypothetical protein